METNNKIDKEDILLNGHQVGKIKNEVTNNDSKHFTDAIDVNNAASYNLERNLSHSSQKSATKFEISRKNRSRSKSGETHCDLCSEVFSNADELHQHKVCMHDLIKPFGCKNCPELFNSERSVALHKQIHEHPPIFCPECNSVFRRTSSYQGHIKVHMMTDNFVCSLCGIEFEYEAYYRKHIMNNHEPPSTNNAKVVNKTQQVKICSEKNKIPSLLTEDTKPKEKLDSIENIDTIKETIQKPLLPNENIISKQEIVKTISNQIKQAKELMPIIPAINERSLISSVDLDEEKSNSDLFNNIKMVFIEKTKTFLCPFCPKTSVHRFEILRHARSHTKPYSCEVCHQQFSSTCKLGAHKLIHMKNDNYYECCYCNQQFAKKYMFVTHMQQHSTKRKYKCIVCGELFYHKTRLQIHARTSEHSQLTYSSTTVQEMPQDLLINDDKFELDFISEEQSLLNTEEMEKRQKLIEANTTDSKNIESSVSSLNNGLYDNAEHTEENLTNSYTLNEKRRKHFKISKKITCLHCSASILKVKFKLHEKLFHSVIKNNRCPYCSRIFKSKALCRQHIRIHKYVTKNKTLAKLPSKITTTTATSKTTRNPKVLTKTESACVNPLGSSCRTAQFNEKEFKSTSFQTNITKNSTTNLENTSDRPQLSSILDYTCPTCGIFYKNMEHLRRHMKTHVRKSEMVKDEFWYKCCYCPKKFRTSGQKNWHIEAQHLRTIINRSKHHNNTF